MGLSKQGVPKIDYGKLAAEVIAIWQSESKDNTLRLLAAESHVSYTWIRLLNKGNQNTSLDMFYRLLMAMWSPNKVKNILLEHTEHGAEILVELEKKGVVFTGLELADLREATFFARIVARDHLTRTEVETLLGADACESVIAKFVGYEFIECNDDGSCTLRNNLHEMKSSQTLKMLSRLVVECHSLLLGDRGDVRIQGLNDEGIDEVYKLISSFQIALIKILTNPKNQGKKVFGITLNSALI